MFKRLAVTLSALACAHALPAVARDLPPALGQNMPLYPGLYFTGSLLTDVRDRAYDQAGNEQRTVAPAAGGQSRFPERLGIAAFTWHFPMFESYGIPYVSSRTHLARVTLQYGRTRADGAVGAFAMANPSFYDTQNSGSGLGDTLAEFGTFLYGAGDWRTRTANPVSVLATFGVNMPTGAYERYAPSNIGSNTWAFHAKLGGHASFWSGGLIEADIGLRRYARNEEPEFGGLAPHKQGQDHFWDASVSQRLSPDFYLGAFGTNRRGGVNEYRNPQLSPNPGNPAPPANSDTRPTPGSYRDQGTALSTIGVSAHWFMTQRWMASFTLQRPVSGRSGEFELAYSSHTPANCIEGAANCTTAPNGSVHEDGYGPARSYASTSWMLSFTHNFSLGDTFTCTGCER